MTTQTARLLGFAPLDGLEALRTALNAVPGPTVHACYGARIAALLQPEPPEGLCGSDRAELAPRLLTVQKRMEVACQHGRFLPVDPSAATCPAVELSGVLSPAWRALERSLRTHGARRQWDIVLSWSPEPILARKRDALLGISGRAELAEAVKATLQAERARREALLLNTLAPVVRAFAADGLACAETGVRVTVLVDAGAEARVEAVLQTLAADETELIMRGPLPPLNFAAVRVETVEADAISRAWRRLDLPEQVNLPELQSRWRRQAAMAHPIRHWKARPEAALTAADMSDAYRTLRPLLQLNGDGVPHTLSGLLRHAGRRLAVPEISRSAGPLPERAS